MEVYQITTIVFIQEWIFIYNLSFSIEVFIFRVILVVHRTEESNALYTNHTNKKIWRKLCDK